METFAKRLFSGLFPDAQIGGLTFNTVESFRRAKPMTMLLGASRKGLKVVFRAILSTVLREKSCVEP